MYAKYLKRVLDFCFSLLALVILSPFLLILTIVGAIAMGGHPFFTQERPGKNEKIFKLLPDEKRLTAYGKILRTSSCDELPELLNILKGDMSFVGPRPLLVEYLPYYYKNERQRHDIRPGLTGWAQVNGRNAIDSWEQRFAYDLEYIKKCSFMFDLKILFLTLYKVIKRSDIQVGSQIKVGRLDDARRNVKKSKRRNYSEISRKRCPK